jgi:hypothetical protein
VAIHLVKIACELPDRLGRSLSQWDCVELARQLVADGVVQSISPQTVGRILKDHRLKPWRRHLWLSPHVPRDAAFAARVESIVALYTRPLEDYEIVLCVDEDLLAAAPAFADVAGPAGPARTGGRIPAKGVESLRRLRPVAAGSMPVRPQTTSGVYRVSGTIGP